MPSRNVRCVCGTNGFTESPFACVKIAHSGFTNLHSKCTWSTVILMPHLHLSVCCAWREIWCATRHAWLRVWSEGIQALFLGQWNHAFKCLEEKSEKGNNYSAFQNNSHLFAHYFSPPSFCLKKQGRGWVFFQTKRGG